MTVSITDKLFSKCPICNSKTVKKRRQGKSSSNNFTEYICTNEECPLVTIKVKHKKSNIWLPTIVEFHYNSLGGTIYESRNR